MTLAVKCELETIKLETYMMKCVWCAVIALWAVTLSVSAGTVRDLYSDTWVATDALGRSLPGFEQVGPPRKDRTVGIFYWTWLARHARSTGEHVYDNTEIIAANPEKPEFGPIGKPHQIGRAHV